MGGLISNIGQGLDAFGNRIKNRYGLNGQQPGGYRQNGGGLLGAAVQGIQRYRQSHHQGSPANMMDMSPVPNSPMPTDSPAGSGATPALMPDQQGENDGGASMQPQVGSPEDMEQSLNAPEASPMSDFEGLGMEAMAQGKVVTRPTLALLGENGPERIQPLNSNPQNKVNAPPMLPRYRGGR